MIPMAGTEKTVMNILLKSLLDQNLIPKDTYRKAVDLVESTIDLPSFFKYDVCCDKRPQALCMRATERSEALSESQKEDETNGCTQNQAGAAAGQVVL